jgi:ElaB/YqjD/DUF883 family membrane-anchored ribosome-binding protein
MTEAAQQLASGKEKVSQGFRELIEGAEELLRSATSYSGEGAEAARAKFIAQVERIKTAASGFEGTASEKYRQVSESADGYVRENPWKAIGIAALSGVVLGALLSRR